MLNLKSVLLLLAVGSLAACNSGGVSVDELPPEWGAAEHDTNGDGWLSPAEARIAWSTLTPEEKEVVRKYFANKDSDFNESQCEPSDWNALGDTYGGQVTSNITNGVPSTATTGAEPMDIEVQEGDFLVTYTFTTEKVVTTTTPREETTYTSAILQDQTCIKG